MKTPLKSYRSFRILFANYFVDFFSFANIRTKWIEICVDKNAKQPETREFTHKKLKEQEMREKKFKIKKLFFQQKQEMLFNFCTFFWCLFILSEISRWVVCSEVNRVFPSKKRNPLTSFINFFKFIKSLKYEQIIRSNLDY